MARSAESFNFSQEIPSGLPCAYFFGITPDSFTLRPLTIFFFVGLLVCHFFVGAFLVDSVTCLFPFIFIQLPFVTWLALQCT